MHKGWFFLVVPALLLVILIDRPDILQPGNRSIDQAISEIDFDSWSTEISTVLFNAEGEIEYKMQAARQVHFLNNTTLLEYPNLSLYKVAGGQWNVTADSGRIEPINENTETTSISAIDRIELIDNVELFQTDDFGNRMVLSTAFLTLDPGLETLSTDQAVHFQSSTIEQTAIGMHADLSRNTVTFLSQIRGRYDATAPE
jgi:LPS export ABC transporter protein LptC